MCIAGQPPDPGLPGPGLPGPGLPGPGLSESGQPPGVLGPSGPPPVPVTAAQAVAMVQAGLGFLAGMAAGDLPAGVQADCLRGLERAESMHTAARARVLGAFAAQGGYRDDGQGSAKAWLCWQTQITSAAAGSAVWWMHRLAEHRAITGALAAGRISASWARCICAWTGKLPPDLRAGADEILLAAAGGGAGLDELAALAQQMRERAAGPDRDGDTGFDDRWLRLDLTFGGSGSLAGGLSPQCAAALGAVLESLGKRAGPEDLRSRGQREHDALEEACRRLVGSGCLPERAGQPTQILLHLTLDQLRGHNGPRGGHDVTGHNGPGGRDGPGGREDDAAAAERAWTAAAAAAGGPAAGPGYDCDASIVPVVSGIIDHDLLDQLAATLLSPAAGQPGSAQSGADRPGAAEPGADRPGTGPPGPGQERPGGGDPPTVPQRHDRAMRAARDLILTHAADLLSGPAGLAAALRARHHRHPGHPGQPGHPGGTISLPLDIGPAADTIPAHLRRAVTARDRRCRFPGCTQPPAACHPHHLIPRADGGPTSLANLLLLCSFHHLIAVHRWGWQITLHPDGTTTATSPDSSKTWHSHSPPASTAA